MLVRAPTVRWIAVRAAGSRLTRYLQEMFLAIPRYSNRSKVPGTSRSIQGMNLATMLLAVARDQPNRPCFRRVSPAAPSSAPQTLTYGDLERCSARLAERLCELGVAPKDRVVVQVDKSLGGVMLYLAVLRLGAVYVPLNVAYTEKEVSFFVADARPRLLVGDQATFDRVSSVGVANGVLAAVLADDVIGLPKHAEALLPWSTASSSVPGASSDPAGEIYPAATDDLAAILYTSGTTGRSKGAMLTHGNLTSNAETLCDIWEITEHDVLLHVLPVFHVHGLFVALNTVISRGGLVLFMEGFEASRAVESLPEATVFMGVPTHYTRLLEQAGFNRAACSTMRLFTSGSAPLDPITFQAFEARTELSILERYGMTEAGMICSNPYQRGCGASEAGFPHGDRVAGTVGFPLPGVEVAICGDGGDELSPGEVGILRARGPNVFAGYWQLPEKTAETMAEEGWLISGDLASCDDRGRVTLVGRSSDMIIVGGYNVYPREIEDCLLNLSAVSEVAVVGVPHPVMGEGVVACLVAQVGAELPTDEELASYLKPDLADFKRPRVFHRLDELPRNAMGKVQKTSLRDRFSRDFQRS